MSGDNPQILNYAALPPPLRRKPTWVHVAMVISAMGSTLLWVKVASYAYSTSLPGEHLWTAIQLAIVLSAVVALICSLRKLKGGTLAGGVAILLFSASLTLFAGWLFIDHVRRRGW